MNNLDLTRFIIQKLLTPPLVLFGCLGNSVNILILTRPVMQNTSTNRYLAALATYDIMYLLLVFIMSLAHYDVIACHHGYFLLRHKFIRPMTNICSNTGVWLTLTFTVERYIGVCHPIKGKVS